MEFGSNPSRGCRLRSYGKDLGLGMKGGEMRPTARELVGSSHVFLVLASPHENPFI